MTHSLIPVRNATRRCLLGLFVLALAGLPLGAFAAERPPNVLFLFTDDQRQDTIHAWGNADIRTPHMDRLVKNGVSFRNAYIMGASSPAVCSPSRACLFSGRTLWNIDCQGLWGFEIPDKFRTLPEVFRESGYETFATGKNEPGKRGHFGRAFSSAEAVLFSGMTKSQYNLPLYQFEADGNYADKKMTMHRGKHSAEVYADACIGFLNRQESAAKPFFAYVAFQTPHDPLNVPDEFLAQYEPDKMKLWPPFHPEHPFDNGMLNIRDEKLEKFPRTEQAIRKRLAAYYGEVTHTDAQIGRILKALDDAGLTENTIVVFASDNGLALGSHGLLGKQNVYEHSVKVPLIISGPGIPRGQDRRQLCYIYDIYPTLCEMAGLKTPETVQFRSLNPVIRDAKHSYRENLYFAFMSWQRAVRDERYKLIEYCVEDRRHTQLFDLKDDPQETRNLAEGPAHKDQLRSLRELLKAERIRLNDGNAPYEFSDQQGKYFWSRYEGGDSRKPE
jgi:arylsulfatase A-like enzyme